MKKKNRNNVTDRVKYILGYVLYRLATFEEICWHGNQGFSNSGFFIGASLALYIVDLCHCIGYNFEFDSMLIFTGVFAFLVSIILDIFVWKKWKKIKARYLHDNRGNEDWALKGWLIVLVLVFPLLWVFTWFETPK
ncbi:MAG: hypothetical protein J6X31_01865 [Bacteroidales bacterium]|nr:hypothetical protein [Bacteroidales bacterium]